MKDDQKTKRKLIEELNELRQCVAELKGFEEEIKQTRANHEKFAKAFLQNSIPIAITTLKEGRFIDVSGTFLVFMECKRDEVIGHTSAEIGFITEEQRVSFLHELTKKGRIENIEIKFRTKGGALRYGLFNAVMMSLGNEKCLLSVMTDITERKQAEEALRESQKQLHQITDNIPAFVTYVKSQDLRYKFVNKTFADAFGKLPEEMIGWQVRETLSEGAYMRALPYIDRARSGERVQYENMVHIHEEDRCFNIDYIPEIDEQGMVNNIIVLAFDITDRKRAEEALGKAEGMLSLVFDSIPAMIWQKDQDGRYLQVNNAYCETIGSAKEVILGKTDYDLFPREIADQYTSHDREILTSGKSEFGIEEYHKKPSGEYGWSVTDKLAYTDDKGNIAGTIGFALDVTERKRFEKTLQMITDNMTDMIRVTNLQGVNLYVSPSHAKVLGYKPEERVGKSGFDILHPNDLEYIMNVFSDGLVNKKPVKLEYRIKHAKGHYLWLETMGDLLRDDQGEVTAVIQCSRDISDRKATEEKLKKSEETYRSIFENAVEGIFQTTTDGRFLTANPALADIFGYDSPEDLMASITNIGVQLYARHEEREENLRLINAKGVMKGFEAQGCRKDGSTCWISINTRLVKNDGDPKYYEGFIEDISERKRAEEALRESEIKYRKLYQSMMDAFVSVDMEGYIKDYNEAYLSMLGYDPEEISTLNYVDITPAKWHAIEADVVEKQVLTNGYSDIYQKEYRRKDGTIFPVELRTTLLRDTAGIPISMWATVHDITDRKLIEKALQESEERFRLLAESARDTIWTMDMNLLYTYMSPYVKQTLDYTPEEYIAKPLNEIMTPASLELSMQILAEELEIEKREDKNLFRSRTIEIEHIHRNGNVVPVEIKLTFIRDDAGQATGILGYTRNITERKQAESDKENLEFQNRQLQKTESLGRMAGAIAHHFNNQLGVVVGNLELAIDDLTQSAGPIKKLTTAMEAANRAAEMSSLMLTYLGQTSDKHEPIDFSEVCLRSLPIIQPTIANNVVLKRDLPTSGPVISANANQIRQVMTNLTTNALEAIGEDGGIIHLKVKTIHPAEIPSAHRYPLGWQPQDSPYACLEVVDTGSGINDKDLEKLYDPFFSTKFTGRGLGLPVALGILKAHGGAITVDSELGRGSTFRVFLPVAAAEVPRQLDKAGQLLAIEGGGAVLLVEDEEMVREMAKAMLTRLGFTVMEAKDGVEAVEMFQRHQERIRFVLCDLTMPRMNGWETLTALRKLAPDIPVILTSGYDKAHVMAGDHPEFPQAFLGKPYKLKGLSDAIGLALNNKN